MSENKIFIWVTIFICVPAAISGIVSYAMDASPGWVALSVLGGGLFGFNALLEKP